MKRAILLGLSALIVLTASYVFSYPALGVTAVNRGNAHLAVWKIFNDDHTTGRSGTAYAIGDRYFLTNAHVLKMFFNQGSTDLFLSQKGSDRVLRVNHDYSVLTVAYDLALFTTQENVAYDMNIAKNFSKMRGTPLRMVGYPLGFFQTLDQAENMSFDDELYLYIPMDKNVIGGFSGSPIFNSRGEVVATLRGSPEDANIAFGIKLEHLSRFLLGETASTACGDFSSTRRCMDAAMAQARRMAEDGNSIAQYQLGRKSNFNEHGDMNWLRRSAEQGFSPAEVTLGNMAYEAKDWEKAAKWLELAANRGDHLAMFKLGFLYYRGNGVIRNRSKAFDLFRESARSGNVKAQYNVGLLYEAGLGTIANRELAIDWFERAADKGHEKAQEKLKALSTTSTGSALEPAKVMWAVKRANVRAGPGTSYEKVDVLGVGEKVRIIERTGSWFKLEPHAGQQERFVYAPLLAAVRAE